jgi:hypothetical protein
MSETSESEKRIALAQAIEDLRAELQSAAAAGKDQPLQFRLQPIELEMKLGMTREGGGGLGIKIYVLDFNAKGKISSEMTHTLKLKLEPVGKDGRSEYLVSDVVPWKQGAGG